ncbi:nicotianamine synthase family protein [Paenibacillus aurantiacus]|uniref:Nicotianamine synthase family protein n=1 Tax=Paenibacillus aurantiacus TaxID=1936118 RepID=A0ABV5KU49_9BACL
MNLDSGPSAVHIASGGTRSPLAANFISIIREVYKGLAEESDLSPTNLAVTNLIDRLKTRLLHSYSPDEVQAVLSDPFVREVQPDLLAKLSVYESESERYYSRQFCQSEQSGLDAITRLPGWNIYQSLVTRELQLLRRFSWQGRLESPIVFVGSGPMPLSAILLHLYSDIDVIGLEVDDEAYAISRDLLDCLGLSDRVNVRLENGETFNYNAARTVFIASLVTNKVAVLEQIRRTCDDPLIAIRTAEGMRQLMYESVDEAQLTNRGWALLGRTTPQEQLVINSTLFIARQESVMHREDVSDGESTSDNGNESDIE